MFFSNALVIGSSLLMATTGVEARAIEKLSFLPHLPLTTSSTSSPSTKALDTLPPPPANPTCAFSPHLPLRTTPSAYSVPETAWPLLATLLSTQILPPSTSTATPDIEVPLPTIQDSVQTLYFRSFTTDESLEGLVLGLVFSAGTGTSSDRELRRSLPSTASEEERRSCVEEAIRKVESGRVMEGVLEVDGRGGTVGFLLYRVD
ncbi:uncharacterized protein RAG0_09261 [Rhynchosporium agropyri]|uniref:Uncharacterized protein n=1 Tax=Rhynchosporium agropyri TaxID=914238 RepID=A0A1E1KUN8_9HELO|nr:uncharacterized protein RAG0_09261 [Rhynchosporium agropyri]